MTTDTTTYPTTTDPAPSNGTGPTAGTGPSDGTGPTTPPGGPIATRPLGDFLPGRPAAGQLAVVLPSGDRVVVVGRADDGQVEVWSLGRLTRRDPDTTASPVTDPAARDGLLAEVVHGLAEQRHAATERATHAVEDRDRDRETHERVLTDIRAYAVDKHQAGDICRSGLNDFLTAFGLPEFQPRVRVRYTLSGSYDVDAEDGDAAHRDARGYLKPDLSELDNVLDDSDTFTVHVDDVEELDS